MRGVIYIASHSLRKFVFVSAALFFAAVFVSSANAQVGIEWIRQFGSPTPSEDAVSVAVDTDGSVYVGGFTSGELPGQTRAGDANDSDFDSFVRKYDSDGSITWTRQFGTDSFDQVFGLSINGPAIYVVGITEGAFGTSTNAGDFDLFVRRYDGSGSEVWTTQIGSSGADEVLMIGSDSTGVYLVGITSGALPGQTNSGNGDAFIVKVDASGSIAWIRQFGTSDFDSAGGVLIDGSNVYVGGLTNGSFPGETNSGGTDIFVRQFDTSGVEGWTVQFGTPSGEELFGAAADATGIYVTGFTTGDMSGTNAGGADVFIRKYDTSGSIVWTRQFGTSAFDQPFAITANDTGVYVTGVTIGLLGDANSGGEDVFVRKYDSDGNIIWTFQFGTPETDEAFGISMFSNELYVVGSTLGTFAGQTHIGEVDAFVVKLVQDDTDGDGIFDEIDLLPATFSDDFADDATTTGRISSRGNANLNLTVRDATSSADGVVAEADAGGSNPKAKIVACGSNFFVSAGDQVVITCGSVTVQVVEGDGVEIEFIADDGTVASTTLTTGNTIIFDTEEATFSAPPGESSTIIVEGNEITLEPGEVLQYVAIDVKPSNGASCVNPDANGVIPVAILSSALFDASTIDPLTVALEGAEVRVRGKGNLGTLKDVDGDGDLDLLLHIQNEITLGVGQSTVTLTGTTYEEFGGDEIIGSDSICVVPPTE